MVPASAIVLVVAVRLAEPLIASEAAICRAAAEATEMHSAEAQKATTDLGHATRAVVECPACRGAVAVLAVVAAVVAVGDVGSHVKRMRSTR